MEKEFKLNDKVMGVDIKIKCIHCNREIMMDRLDFKKKLKGVIDEKVQED